MQKIAVYCGSNFGESKNYFDATQELGRLLAEQNLGLVYGGGKVGLMGTIADAVLAHGGHVTGVIPTFLRELEKAHDGLSELIETPDMTVRKQEMIVRADAYIAMPGGVGTFEELFEVLSMGQLRLQQKPIGLLDVDGFYQPLLALIEQAITSGFMPESNRTLMVVDSNPQTLLDKMRAYEPVYTQKWHQPQWMQD
ncbi:MULTISPECIES: TIGR00730 family Rossman fold protein [Vitreoscilla]|uniref:Cytokinin riboside 5'-monophosphate phosphoribohydrolase n=1 Tax=Vitreoscilla stercoraria TaxID=61 RepID=A0ABY4EBN7_VITST|nr:MULTISPECIES: TIGR00730 family Rossman fold protein [Vitreoscilla]AUZ05751.2 putative lysine decarboxylase [Vitreoscilla sp. C1]UOO92867.1 TIGR00730 family Rossman fold protein [Vitreoscilla stercoraria]